ncbi:unnamed protein product [Symbiodinium pilosum]|uniref:Uncharacterized protein n=1 Tax=Symbiodinium pilosum TaxID=2952 RepID=A0A812X5V8_SYMPI|nr:unnamed protein product [Symbiodinium pilosum]
MASGRRSLATLRTPQGPGLLHRRVAERRSHTCRLRSRDNGCRGRHLRGVLLDVRFFKASAQCCHLSAVRRGFVGLARGVRWRRGRQAHPQPPRLPGDTACNSPSWRGAHHGHSLAWRARGLGEQQRREGCGRGDISKSQLYLTAGRGAVQQPLLAQR